MPELRGTDFKPARPWNWLIAAAGQLNRLVISRHTLFDVSASDLALLRGVPRGCLIAPNHCHYHDAQVTFELARRAGRRVVFMATRELFDGGWGLGGFVYQRMGVFSVNRGAANDEARAFAGRVLAAGTRDLLMFPEGEVFLLNDLVMPLKPGCARLALEVADRLAQANRLRPVVIVPVAIKYQYVEDIGDALEALTERLEQRVFGEARQGPLYPRIVDTGAALVARYEQMYGVRPVAGADLFGRIERLRAHLLDELEQKYFGSRRDGPHFDRARKLMIHIQGSLLASTRRGGPSGSRWLPAKGAAAPDLETVRLCARSVAFQKDYLLTNPTPERTAETLVKLEREVLGTETRLFGKRRAIVRIGGLVDVTERLPHYRTAPDEGIETVVIEVHDAIQGLLESIEKAGEPTPSAAG